MSPLSHIRKVPGLFFSLLLCITAPAQVDSVYPSADTTVTDAVTEEVKDETDEEEGGNFIHKSYWDTGSLAEPRKIPAEKIKSLQEEDAFWYANATIEKKKPGNKKDNTPAYTPLGEQAWFKTLVWFVIIASFVAFIIWFLADSNVGLFRKKNIVIGNGDEEMIPEDIFAINYQREIDKAAREENYRLAVRLHFLQLLKNMADRNVIQYKQDRTNLDYLFQLQATRHYTDFFRITRNYEYSWYGQFAVSAEAYRQIRKDVEQFEKQLY